MMALSVTNSNVVSVILEDSTDEQETARTCNDSWIAGFIGGLNGRAATDTNMQRRLDRWISSRTRRTSSKRHEHATPLGPLDFLEDSTDEQQTTRTCNDAWIAVFPGGLDGRAANDTNMRRRLDHRRTRQTSSKRHEHATTVDFLDDSTDEQQTTRTCNNAWTAGFLGGLDGRAANDTNMQRRLDHWISWTTRRTSSTRHEHATTLGSLDFLEGSTDEQQTPRTCNDAWIAVFLGRLDGRAANGTNMQRRVDHWIS